MKCNFKYFKYNYIGEKKVYCQLKSKIEHECDDDECMFARLEKIIKSKIQGEK